MSLYRNSLGALSGSPSLGDLAASRLNYRARLLTTQPAYAWLGSDLPAAGAITAWVDAVTGVVAMGAGTIPQVATPAALGERKAVSVEVRP